jgi:hypothetical protein
LCFRRKNVPRHGDRWGRQCRTGGEGLKQHGAKVSKNGANAQDTLTLIRFRDEYIEELPNTKYIEELREFPVNPGLMRTFLSETQNPEKILKPLIRVLDLSDSQIENV